MVYFTPCKSMSNAERISNKKLTTTRRARGYGTLINKRGKWVMRWRVDGRTVQESTPFRVDVKADRARAEKLLEERTEIFRLKREEDQLAILIRRREDLEARIKRLQELASARRALLLGDLEAEWRASPRRRDCSADQLERCAAQLAAFVVWAGAEVDLRAVDDAMAERYAKHLAARLGGNSYNKHVNTLAAIWRAVGRAWGVGNPWADLPRRRLDTHVRRALTREEVDAIIQAAEGEYKALIIIGARTGLRLGDACRLKWEDFGADGVLRVKTSKTGAAVALPGAALREELAAATTSGQQQGLIMPGIAERYERDPAGVSNWVCRYFQRAGIVTKVKERGWGKARADASYHSLRHTFVTRAIEAGVPAPIVRALVGHNTAAMTDRYSHIGEAAILREFQKIL